MDQSAYDVGDQVLSKAQATRSNGGRGNGADGANTSHPTFEGASASAKVDGVTVLGCSRGSGVGDEVGDGVETNVDVVDVRRESAAPML